MNHGGAMPSTAPTGWVYLKSDCTVRWKRGDREAYVLHGNQVGKWLTEDALGTIPVSRTGWSDVAEIKLAGENWTKTNHRCRKCGGTQ